MVYMRVFIAMDVNDEDTINNMMRVQREILKYAGNAKPTSREQLHFTLMFIGEVSSATVESIVDRLNMIDLRSVGIEYKGVGVFPSMSNARIVWAGADEGSASALKGIASEIEDRLRELGFRSDKEFVPHITLLRIKDRVRDPNFTSVLNKYRDVVLGREVIRKIKVKRSDLFPTGPVYTDIAVIEAKE